MSTPVAPTSGIFPCCEPKFSDHHHQIIRNSGNETSAIHNSQSDIEAMLVQGMKDLSFDELQREQEDLHGVPSGIDKETDDVVDELLNSMKEHLDQIKAETAYGKAEAKNPEYVHRRDFQIIFLRGNRNDPKAAAEQMIRYYDLKQELFGEESLCRDITTKDLNEEDMDNLMNGSVQLASCRDMAGRVIAWGLPGLRADTVSVFHELRARFYFGTDIVQAMDDPSRGIVMVCYCIGKFDDHTKGAGFQEGIKLSLAMPCNIAGFHLCFSNRAQTIMAKAAVSVMPPHLRAKTKVHFGSHCECQYYLSTYGIPREALPFDLSSNEVDLTNHKRWIQECRLREINHQSGTSPTTAAASTRVNGFIPGETPTENDVLCIGRKVNGKGNERLISLAVLHADTYDTGSPKVRRKVVETIMEAIWNHGGRFLQVDTSSESPGDYVEVPDKVMREKICQTFRNLRYRKAGVQKSAASSTQRAEMPTHPPVLVDELKPEDVLFGKIIKDHPGNQRLREMVESMSAKYDAANRGEKKILSDGLVRHMKEKGARFLRQVDGGRSSSWEVVSDKIAEKKIAAHFRNIRRKQRK